MSEAAFYDAHCHALTLSHPSFLAFTQTLRRRGLEEIYAHIASPNYLITALFFNAGERMRNMLSVMEHDVASIFEIMEDDLAGKFGDGSDAPLLRGGVLELGAFRYDRLVLCPLIMDFQGVPFTPSEGVYYDRPSAKSLAAQVRDLLEGIRDYRRRRPDGFLEIRPFLGVDSRRYSAESLMAFLDASFEGYARGEDRSREAFAAMSDFSAERPPPAVFAGVKVYPPLGFDPWPEEGPERKKVELLWSFCERRGIPVVTHCDDQGFRVLGLDESWRLSSPARWEGALRAHPELRLDFAHFGAQYAKAIGRPPSIEWTERIAELMALYPNVYADVSFNGSEAEYYRWLGSFIAGLGRERASILESRLLFGSDFVVNLTKLRSYSDYYRLFAASPLSDELKARMGRDNPESFLFR